MTGADPSQLDDQSEAQRLFYAHLLEAQQSQRPIAIESLCAARPDLAAELNSLHENYRAAQGAVGQASPPSAAAELYRSLRASDGRATDEVERLCRERPDLERELRQLHADHLAAAATSESQDMAESPDVGASPLVLSELLESFRGARASERGYFYIDTIARGGFAVVEKVWDGRLRRVVARKALPGDVRAERLPVPIMRRLSRFLAEAQIQSQLSHPAILPVVDVGIDERGRAYYTMPLVHGDHFGLVIERVRRGEAGVSLERAIQILAQACDAMAYAHAKGVIHRDLKPQNLMVGKFGETFVMDWGLARVVRKGSGSGDKGLSVELSTLRADLDAESGRAMLTQDGDVLGTPAFMAPEQAAGQVSETGHLADQYSIGAMLYQLLTGGAPYSGSTPSSDPSSVVDAVRRTRPASVSVLAPKAPAELVSICERAMARVPAERYPSAKLLGEDLRAYLEGRVVRAHATGAIAELRKWVKRNKLAATALFAIIASLAGGYWIQSQSNRALKAEQAVSAEQLRKARWASYRSDLKEVQARIDGGDVTPEASRILAACDQEHRGWEWEWLDYSLDESDRVLEGGVKRVAFSPDSTLVAGASGDATTRVWERATGRCLHVLHGHVQELDCVAFSRDGRVLATGGHDATLRLWDLVSGRQLAMGQFPHIVWSVTFLADGRVLTACEDRHVRLHDGSTLAEVHKFPPFASIVWAVATDGQFVAAGDDAGEVRVWQLPGYELVSSYRAQGVIRELAFDPKAALLWGVAGSTSLFRCELRSNIAREVVIPLTTEERLVARQYFGLSAERGLIGVRSNATIDVVNLDGGHRAKLSGPMFGANDFSMAPDGFSAATAHDDAMRLWSLERAGASRKLVGPGDEVRDLAFDPTSPRLFASGGAGKVVAFDLRDPSLPRQEIDTKQGPIHVALSPDGRVLVTVRQEDGPGFLKRWDGITLAPLADMTFSAIAYDFDWSRDGRLLLFGKQSQAVIWYGFDGEQPPRAVGRTHTLHMQAVAFAPTSDRFATLDQSGDLCVWRTADGEKLLEMRPHQSGGWALAWSPNGSLFATAGGDEPWHGSPTVRLFDAASGNKRGEVKTTNAAFTLAFSPDSRRLCFADGDQYVRLLDTASCEPVLSIKTDSKQITRVAFSADGRFLAAGDSDGNIHLWYAGPADRGPRAR